MVQQVGCFNTSSGKPTHRYSTQIPGLPRCARSARVNYTSSTSLTLLACSSSSRMETVWTDVLPYQRALTGSMAGLIMVDGLRPSSSRGIVDVRTVHPCQSMYYKTKTGEQGGFIDLWTGEQENRRTVRLVKKLLFLLFSCRKNGNGG